jgi:hypothetical protein
MIGFFVVSQDIVNLVEVKAPAKRGSYKKKSV